MNDNRLIGTWKSDKPRTFRRWRWRKNMPEKQRKFLKSLFGRLEVTYTKQYCTTNLDGFIQKFRYLVVAKDSTSVVIESEDTYSKQKKLTHIFFDETGYWIPIGESWAQEWFQKIKP